MSADFRDGERWRCANERFGAVCSGSLLRRLSVSLLEVERAAANVLIAAIGIEGGGVTICGRLVDGVWTYWTKGSSMDLDERDDEVRRTWSSESLVSLDLVVPRDWPMFSPAEIHPDFVEWFRENYDKARALLPDDQRRSQDKHRHRRWLAVLGSLG
jgi:hypothetical protein